MATVATGRPPRSGDVDPIALRKNIKKLMGAGDLRYTNAKAARYKIRTPRRRVTSCRHK
jgi:hypothetical protein